MNLIYLKEDYCKTFYIELPEEPEHSEIHDIIFDNKEIDEYISLFDDRFCYSITYGFRRYAFTAKGCLDVSIRIYKIDD